MEYLLVMSLSGSVMVGIYMLLRYVTGNKISARLQYMLAKIAVLYYLIPLPFIKKWYDRIAVRIHPVIETEILKVSCKSDYYAFRANGKLYYSSYTKIQAVVISLWLLIALIILALELFDYLKTVRTLTRCINKTRIKEDDSINRLKEQCGLRRKILVYQGENGERTAAFGIFKPIILCGRKMENKEAEWILHHELIHIKRCDMVWKILRRFIILLHWWNPVAWFLYFDFERVCEWSCDEETVLSRTKEETKEYVRLLIAESTKNSDEAKPHVRWSVGFGNEAAKLKERIENIMKLKKWNKIASGIIAVGLVAVNSLTVFAYPDVIYQESKKHLTQDEIDDAMDGDDWVYIPAALDDEELGEYALYRGEDINILYDKQFTDADGNMYPIQDENSTDVYASCTHTYVSGTIYVHTKDTNEGCTLTTYSAQRCGKCGDIIKEDYKYNAHFASCRH